VVARRQLLCNEVGRGQCKMEVVAKKYKKGGNNQPEVWLHEWWCGGNCHAMTWQCKVEVVAKKEKRLQSTRGVAVGVVARQQLPCDEAGRGHCKMEVAAKKGGNNQPEVWLREWWHGCYATLLQQAVGSTKWKWKWVKKKEKGNNQLEVWQHEWWRGSSMSGGKAVSLQGYCKMEVAEK